MVTSWLWVLLTDIASFKPTFLPDDNPADFSYFFDTSRRRLCYVAPERFVGAPDHRLAVSTEKRRIICLFIFTKYKIIRFPCLFA